VILLVKNTLDQLSGPMVQSPPSPLIGPICDCGDSPSSSPMLVESPRSHRGSKRLSRDSPGLQRLPAVWAYSLSGDKPQILFFFLCIAGVFSEFVDRHPFLNRTYSLKSCFAWILRWVAIRACTSPWSTPFSSDFAPGEHSQSVTACEPPPCGPVADPSATISDKRISLFPFFLFCRPVGIGWGVFVQLRGSFD